VHQAYGTIRCEGLEGMRAGCSSAVVRTLLQVSPSKPGCQLLDMAMYMKQLLYLLVERSLFRLSIVNYWPERFLSNVSVVGPKLVVTTWHWTGLRVHVTLNK
jgi:hypothetical protein